VTKGENRGTLIRTAKYIILAALIYMPLFGHLGTFPIRVWDEARVAMNAYEMLHDGDFIVTHFNGNPDMWNTKPPLLIWTQVAFMKVIGVNEIAVRLPSALAAFFTCLALMLFSIRYLRNFWLGFIAIIILVTSYGYIVSHAARMGDYDSLLTLFTTLSGLFIFLYSEHQKTKYLYLFFAFTAFAVLTKSISGLLFIPGLLIYLAIQKRLVPLLSNKHFYLGLFSAILVILSYYLLRENYNPGYLKAVINNELWTRYLTVIETHENSFWYYFNNLTDQRFSPWYILIPPGFIAGIASKDLRIKRLTIFTLLMIITYLLIISTSRTKLAWYDVPLYPFLSILVAIFINFLFELPDTLNLGKTKTWLVKYAFLIVILFSPYQKIFDKTYLPREDPAEKDFYELGYYLKEAINGEHDLNQHFLLYDGYNLHNLFYIKILNDQGVQIDFKKWTELEKNDLVIAQQENVKQYIEDNYTYQVKEKVGNVFTYKITGIR
jgi:4-amino-4-deoxy-L-arabinose transferase-like glycosyltransferase